MTTTRFGIVTTDTAYTEYSLPNLAQLIEPLLPGTIITAACFLLWWSIARKYRRAH